MPCLEDSFAILSSFAIVMSQKSRSRSPSPGDSQALASSIPSGDNHDAGLADRSGGDDDALTAIAARRAAGEFPLAKPMEVDEAIRVQAEEALAWVRKDEAVRLQSFIDHQYKLYRESLPHSASPGKPESVIHAEWAREWYYFHLKAFLAQNECVRHGRFVSPVPPELLPAPQQVAAQDLLLQLKHEWVPAFKTVVRAKLEEFLALLRSTPGLDVSADIVTDSWYKKNLYTLLAFFLDEQRTSVFEPQVCLDTLGEHERQEVVELCERLDKSHEKTFHEHLETVWEREWQAMPTAELQQQREVIKKTFVAKTYKRELAAYVSRLEQSPATAVWEFHSKVDVNDLRTEQEKLLARTSMSRVRQSHMEPFDRELAERWNKFAESLPGDLPPAVASSIEQKWLIQNYFSVLDIVLEGAVEAFEFQPAVPLSDVPEGGPRTEAEALLRGLTREQATLFQSELEATRAAVFSGCDLGDMRDFVEQQWTAGNYYKVMARVVRGSDGSAPSRHHVNSSAEPRESISSASMLVSPKKRAKRNPDAQSGGPLALRSQLHGHGSCMSHILVKEWRCEVKSGASDRIFRV
jgi:hypothetical protein